MTHSANPFIFSETVDFCSAKTRMAIDAANSFHDAYIDTCSIEKDRLSIRIKNIYFPETCQYNSFRTDGIRMQLRLNGPVDPPMLGIIKRLADRTIYSLDYQLYPTYFSGDLQELYNIKLSFAPEESTFSWVFRSDI